MEAMTEQENIEQERETSLPLNEEGTLDINEVKSPTGVEEREVDFDQAKDDEKPRARPRRKEEETEDVVDLLRPKADIKVWEIGKDDYRREYTQKPLSFISKMQWFALVGEVLDSAMGGPNALSMNSLLSAPGSRGALTMDDFRDADTFVHAIGKLLVYAPDFLVRSFVIWLGVPDFEKDLAARIMQLPPEEGGLTDDQGFEIVAIFIDQNYEALDNFFRERIASLQKRVQARVQDASKRRESQQSRP